MENCTIYSHELKFDQILSIIKENLPKAQIEIEDGGLQKSMIATIKGGFGDSQDIGHLERLKELILQP